MILNHKKYQTQVGFRKIRNLRLKTSLKTSQSRRTFCTATVVVAGSAGSVARAQLRVDVTGVGSTQIPIALANFSGDTSAAATVTETIKRNLSRIGNFKLVEGLNAMGENDALDYTAWRNKSVDAQLVGSVNRLANGRLDVRFRLGDTLKSNLLDSQSLVSAESDLRFSAHRIADIVFEKLTGQQGIFATRIAFVSKAAGRYRLNVSDWDGENIYPALISAEPIMSPSWSPDGARLAYVSFENKKPVVYVQNIYNQQRKAVANFKGSNSAPAWAPDGNSLAVTLTRDGASQIYVIGVDGNGLRRVTQSNAIDTEPVFTPDGQTLYFTSDRGGSPQIYRTSVQGGEASRITFNGNYNVSPRISPDGRRLAYVTRRESRYNIATRELGKEAQGSDQILSETGRDESPSFAPNSRWILYAARTSGRDELRFVSIDGRIKLRISSSSTEVREPAWGPFAK
jgi:TolB protein